MIHSMRKTESSKPSETHGADPGRPLDGVEVDRVFTDTVPGKDTCPPQLAARLSWVVAVLLHGIEQLGESLDELAGTDLR